MTVRLADSNTPLALRLDVVDAGPGIDAPLLAGLFEREVRPAGDRRGESNGNGNGLGLYIVRRVMDMHRGGVRLVRHGSYRASMRPTIVHCLTHD